MNNTFFDGYCSTVQGLLDWFEVDLGFTELSFIQIDLCALCVFMCMNNTQQQQPKPQKKGQKKQKGERERVCVGVWVCVYVG